MSSAREVIVRPASARVETMFVFAMAASIIAAFALRFEPERSQRSSAQKPAYVLSTKALTPNQAKLYSEALESVDDIVAVRDEEGAWPEVSVLDEYDVKLFDSSQLADKPSDAMTWVSYDGGSWVDYFGIAPRTHNGRALVIRVIDLHADYHPHPHPGIDYDPNQFTAAQFWVSPPGTQRYPGERLPEAGWLWVQSGD